MMFHRYRDFTLAKPDCMSQNLCLYKLLIELVSPLLNSLSRDRTGSSPSILICSNLEKQTTSLFLQEVIYRLLT
jgi:hypothetical protein